MKRRQAGRREERRARGAAGRRRAQMYLGQLRWLEGFPAEGRWWVVGGEPADLVVDGLAIARARRTINTLHRDHADALKDLLDNPGAWFAAAGALLGQLGERAHARAPDPGDLLPARVRTAARALAGEHPDLRPLVEAATSAWVLRPRVLAAALAWMRPRARDLTRLLDGGAPAALRRALSLAMLADAHAAGVDALIALALTDVPDGPQTYAQLANLMRRVWGSDKAAAPPAARSGATIGPWVDRLLSRDVPACARALDLLAAIDLAGALAPWRAWEQQHAARIARAQALAEREPFTGGPKLEDRQQVIAGIDRARQAMPAALNLVRVLQAVDTLAEPAKEVFHRAARRLLAVWPEEHEVIGRPRFIEHAADSATFDPDADPKAAWLWEAVAAELRAGAPARILAPWRRAVEGHPQGWIEDQLLHALRRPADVRRLGTGLARLGSELPFTIQHARVLAAVLAAGLDVDRAAALARRLDLNDVKPSERLVRAARALVGDDVEALVAPVRAMHAARDELGVDTEEPLALLCEHAAATGGGWLISAMLARDARHAVQLAELASFAPRRLWPRLPGAASRPDWIDDYPPRLAEPLARLAAADPDAERTARRRTAPELADRSALAREIEALRARAPLGPRQARRLTNLETRLASPRPPTAARLESLAARIDAAAIEIASARFAAAVTAAAQTRLTAQLGIDAESGWASDRTRRSILMALVNLDGTDRTLARRLLEARRGPPPWDLRDDPANRGFLTRLHARGVDPTAWLDDGARVLTGGDGQPVEVAFSHDPLEVFEMGAHFRTCLAPGGSNFFSVVTNAADVNKRVLYARRDGKVIGRCLIALTDGGELLTFHPYAHDNRLKFDDVVARFAVQLATRMGTRVAATGRVTTLLGRDWYDDGVRDLVGRYGPLEAPAFKKALEEVPLSGAVALIVKTLGRPLDDLTLPVVVAATAIGSRPQLILALAPLLLAQPNLPEQTLTRAASLAALAGDPELADRLLLGPASRADLQFGTWFWGQVLARQQPSLALARLRQTRRRGVRGWKDEWGSRLAVAALAMQRLHRPRQAAAMFRRAIVDEPWLKDDLDPLIAALEGARPS